jgi:APA family basic amino acid/polyamine antiporter
MDKKIGFWPVFGIVTGSQIGTGAFLFPAQLAPFGFYSFIGWLITGFGAICLACVFANFATIYAKDGGPHIYVERIFGKNVAFFVGWTYWVISWVSTSVVVISSIAFLSPFIGTHSEEFYIILQILLLSIITYLNIRGIGEASNIEFFLTLLKIVPLIIIPILCLFYFDSSNIAIDSKYQTESPSFILGKIIGLTLWGFIGLESVTCSTSSIKNPTVTIPMAIIFGTSTVAILYLFNSFAIMGIIPSKELALSSTPYVDVIKKLMQGNWYLLISLISSITCIGSLNAWMLTSGQISLSLAEEGFFPKIFAKKNNAGSPYLGLIIACILIIPLLIVTADKNILEQLKSIIEFSVIAFVYVYLICSISYFIIHISTEKIKIWKILSTIIAIGFCVFIILETSFYTHLIASYFIIAGIPMFIWYKNQKKFN